MSLAAGVELLGTLGQSCATTVAVILVLGVLILAVAALITAALVVRRIARWEAALTRSPLPDATTSDCGFRTRPPSGDVA